jgi:exopolyphosphatase/guanosine-5'-triphosphate,3'-diphosphate pyrophosphatase
MLGRIRHEDVRERTINTLSERYQVDTGQASRVERAALLALSQVAPVWQLDDDESSHLLGWAARLHEIGLAIAHSGYHKHGAYLLGNSDLPGFTNREQQRLAMLVRAHRRKFPMAEFKQLGTDSIGRCLRLSVLLRLAVLLHRSHSDKPLPPLIFTPTESGLKLNFPPQWLEEHPLTFADLESEAAYLKSAKFTLEFA